MALFLVTSNPRWRPAAILEYFEWPYAYLRNDSFDPLISLGHLFDSTACSRPMLRQTAHGLLDVMSQIFFESITVVSDVSSV